MRGKMIRLCSNSLVRQGILREYGIPFVLGENFFNEESITESNPARFVYQATMGKHRSALECYGLELPILVADSVVCTQGVLQRKAKNAQEAHLFLQKQSGKALCVLSCAIFHAEEIYVLSLNQTCFELAEFLEKDLREYLESGLWRDKAGAVMVEGFHRKYIQRQRGSFSNAMGLDMESLLPFIRKWK